MECFKVIFAKSVKKDFKKIPKLEVSKILNEIAKLAKKLKEEKLFRIRVGNYRVIYEIKDKLMLTFVVKLGCRKEIYCN